MARVSEYDKFVQFTLGGKPNSTDKITLPISFITKTIKAIIKDTTENNNLQWKEFLELEYDKIESDLQLSEFVGLSIKEHDKTKFKEEFLYELNKRIKKFNQ